MKTKRIVIGFQATAEDAEKLAALAQHTGRVPSEVMRHLLRHAQLTGVPDIQTPVLTRESMPAEVST